MKPRIPQKHVDKDATTADAGTGPNPAATGQTMQLSRSQRAAAHSSAAHRAEDVEQETATALEALLASFPASRARKRRRSAAIYSTKASPQSAAGNEGSSSDDSDSGSDDDDEDCSTDDEDDGFASGRAGPRRSSSRRGRTGRGSKPSGGADRPKTLEERRRHRYGSSASSTTP